MASPDNLVLIYKELADRHERQGQPQMRDRFLVLAADAAHFAADRAMQTLGGFGYAAEYDVTRYFTESRLMKLAPLPQEMVLNYLGEHVLGLPRSY